MLFLKSLATPLVLGLLSACAADMVNGVQSVFDASGVRDSSWHVSVSDEWDVLGPFPIQAREQHFLSPSFPLNLSESVDFDAKWPSSYADGGSIGWTHARSKPDGTLDVSFPDIRWASLRATEGWAALQHHTVLRTSITVHPPSTLEARNEKAPHLLIDVQQGSFFTVIPSRNGNESSEPVVPKWYMGNIYAMNRAPAQSVLLPDPPSQTSPTTYDLFVSGDYEIRLFGDPLFNNERDGVPVLSVTVSVDIEPEPATDTFVRVPSHDVSCDFVDGWAFGDAIGVGIRSISGWWTVKGISPIKGNEGINLILVNETRIAPGQTRIVPIRITQNASFMKDEISFDLDLASETASGNSRVRLPIKHYPQWNASESPADGITATYFFATSMPTAFRVNPPLDANVGEPRPPVLALHGAGVDVLDMPFFLQAIPRQQRSWVIVPTGRTAWGLDWHGPSARDAWSTVDALYSILAGREAWSPYMLAEHTRVLVLGHSNGGQGTWYLASRYPDRVVAAIPAAAYIKSQSYVPLTQSRFAHYIDPAVRAIMETSLTPDDNDLFLTNLVDTPICAIHGGDDENVPVWHTREYVSTLKTWNPSANVTYREVPGELHWYPSVFNNDNVQAFMHSILEGEPSSPPLTTQYDSQSFTLTVSNPSESGTMHGWQIRRLLVPGRLARLTVKVNGRSVAVQTVNVATFSIQHLALSQTAELTIDNAPVRVVDVENDHQATVNFIREEGSWKQSTLSVTDLVLQASGRMSNILLTAAPLVIVVDGEYSDRALSGALRISHNLNVYHKLDVEIIDQEEALQRFESNSFGEANIIVLGGPRNTFIATILHQGKTEFGIEHESLYLKGRPLSTAAAAAVLLHPHPSNLDGLMLLIHTCSDGSLERALRLFPIRTGIPIPDWIVVDEHADIVGAAGVEGVGVWGSNWDWNEATSWF